MPNKKVLQAAKERRIEQMAQARRVYRRHEKQIPELIRRLGIETSEQAHDTAFNLLAQMDGLIVSELLAALTDPNLDEFARDEVASLLGASGDERARLPLWELFQKVRQDEERASSVALSLSGLGDERILPFLRTELDAEDPERVENAVASLIAVGELEDVDRLRSVHRRFLQNEEVRLAVANAILAILGETDPNTLQQTMDSIRTKFSDRALWADLWLLLEETFGPGA